MNIILKVSEACNNMFPYNQMNDAPRNGVAVVHFQKGESCFSIRIDNVLKCLNTLNRK